jgi:hypothetical protein
MLATLLESIDRALIPTQQHHNNTTTPPHMGVGFSVWGPPHVKGYCGVVVNLSFSLPIYRDIQQLNSDRLHAKLVYSKLEKTPALRNKSPRTPSNFIPFTQPARERERERERGNLSFLWCFEAS